MRKELTLEEIHGELLSQLRDITAVCDRNGIEYMKELNGGLQSWMEQKNYECIDQFRGNLALKQSEKASMLMRTQFMNYFADIK